MASNVGTVAVLASTMGKMAVLMLNVSRTVWLRSDGLANGRLPTSPGPAHGRLPTAASSSDAR